MADQRRSSRGIDKLLHAKPARMAGGTSSILFMMFWQIVQSITGASHDMWNRNMKVFLEDPRNGIPNNERERSSARGNITKEFSRGNMSWKVFCKGIRFLQIVKFEFVIKAHHPNGSVTSHSTMVHLQRTNTPEDLNDDIESDKDHQ